MNAIKNRAETPAQKKKVLDRLYKLWTKGDIKYLRLGQLIGNVFQEHYNVEDEDFITTLEDFYKPII